MKQDLPNHPTSNDNLTAEAKELDRLTYLYPRSTSGNVSFTSVTSEITYNTSSYDGGKYNNQGQQGMLLLLQEVLNNYLLVADDYNNVKYINNIKNLGCIGDNSADEYNALYGAIDNAESETTEFYIPKGTYKIESNQLYNTPLGVDGNSNGLSDGWTGFANSYNGSIVYSIENNAQKITISGGTNNNEPFVYIRKPVTGSTVYSFGVLGGASGDVNAALMMTWYNASLGLITNTTKFITPSTPYTTLSVENVRSPISAAWVDIKVRIIPTGSGVSGSVWFKEVQMVKGSAIHPSYAPLTVPSNISFDFEPGAILNLVSATPLVFNGEIKAGLHQIFDGNGMIIGSPRNTYIPIDWFGDTNTSITIVPTSSSSSGFKGQISWDSNYIYVCVDTNNWKRVAMSTW